MTVSGTSPDGAEMSLEIDCLRSGMAIALITPNTNPAYRAEVARIDRDDPTSGPIVVRGLSNVPPNSIKNVVDYEVPVGCQQEYIYSVWNGDTLVDELRLYPPETLRDDCGQPYVLRDLMNPQESIAVSFCFGTIDTMEYAIRAGIFNVIGRRDPVVVTDSQEMARGTLRFISRNRDELYDLRRLLTEIGNPLLFQMAHKYELGRRGVLYMMPLTITEHWLPDGRIPQHVFEVEMVEISPPPTSQVLTKTGIPFDYESTSLPWLNRAGGAEVPNGTSTHTVNFGFTATAGTLLVLVAAGNSTAAHTVSGYTQQVDSGNAYGHVTVLTKTAAGGETSAAIGHTGTGANVVWQVYEFVAGSAWTSSTQLADSTTTFPTLSGLPGISAPQLVMAAFARGSLNTASSGASAAGWTGTTVEHADAFVLGGSAGFWMANAHEPLVTATSVVPAATITGSGNFTASPWIKVVFAQAVVAVPDPVWPHGGLLQRYATFGEMALSGKTFADVYFDVP